MATYHAQVSWQRGSDEFLRQKYSRGHRWTFDEGVSVPASASPHAVRAPWHVTAAVDPEEALAAALASCHMLFFLSYCSAAGFTVEAYEDAPEGLMAKNERGKDAMTAFTLRPLVTFKERAPSEEEFMAMHHKAHDECYVANSLRAGVTIQPTMRVV
ncbi:MAG: OsmC family protein [Gemmatimonadaceae bacterium]|jgi:organic hydroperoxide reductase OsmC/OhrA|nr:OsmC family protein [Gemmatimonadaceae bacterium]